MGIQNNQVSCKLFLALSKISMIVGLVSYSFLIASSFASADNSQIVRTPLVASTDKGNFTFQIELAVTDSQRMKGLMFRREMAADHGMLFDFLTSKQVLMWMKNTYLPLDMVFIKEGGIVARIAKNTVPHSLAVISSRKPVRYVLELNAGTAAKIGLKEGHVLQNTLFGNYSTDSSQ